MYLVGLGAICKRTSWKDLPVVKHTLGEGLASGVGPKVSCEPEGLVDGQVGLDDEHGGAGGLCLLEHVTSPPVEHTVDSSNCVLRALQRKMINNQKQIFWQNFNRKRVKFSSELLCNGQSLNTRESTYVYGSIRSSMVPLEVVNISILVGKYFC